MHSSSKPVLAAVLLLSAISAVAGSAEAEIASEWVTVQASKVRLVAGWRGTEVIAGVELQLGDGWKTYWRSPGDAGGVPPFFDWSGSENVKDTAVLYPAPKRLTDKAGDSIGYKGGVVFPVRVALADPSRPGTLRLKMEYGICREICVPAEAALSVELFPGAEVPANVLAALALVPGTEKAGGPKLETHTINLAGAAPKIALAARFPNAGDHNDVFAEASGGIYLPPPKRLDAEAGGIVHYEIDLAGLDLAELKGKTVTVTLVSDAGQAESRFKID